MRRPRRNRRALQRRLVAGFTLIEMMIALVILAGGMLAMASVQLEALRGGQRGRHLGQATSIAESQLEQLQRERWTNIPATPWTAPIVVTQDVDAAVAEQESTYLVNWRITTLTPGSTRAIDVQVAWTEPSGSNRSVILSSVRNNYEGL
jgi:type IV pilus assembly protein PilV